MLRRIRRPNFAFAFAEVGLTDSVRVRAGFKVPNFDKSVSNSILGSISSSV